jgi:hypothetical protein
MKFKKFRLNKTCIYESDNQSLEAKARMACLMGYPFIKDGENYYEVSTKEYKNKSGTIGINLVEVELVSHSLK